MAETIYTVGHSNRELEEFLALLTMAGIEAVADVRTYPSSRRHPWFNSGNLAEALRERGIRYRHLTAIGGMREEPEPDPSIAGVPDKWRAYAAHVQSEEFERGLERLVELAESYGPVAFMCAERDPDRCHRQFIADVLTLRGREVVHLIRAGEARGHEARECARHDDDGQVTYPSQQRELPF